VLHGGWPYSICARRRGITSGFSQSTPYISTQDSAAHRWSHFESVPRGLLQPAGAAAAWPLSSDRTPFVNSRRQNPTVHQFSFAFSRELPGKMSLQASYVIANESALTGKSIDSLSIATCLGDLTKGVHRLFERQVSNPFEACSRNHHQRSTVARNQLLRAFPEFTASPNDSRKVWYNSLQSRARRGRPKGFVSRITPSRRTFRRPVIECSGPKRHPVLTAYDRPQRFSLAAQLRTFHSARRRFLFIQQRHHPYGWWRCRLCSTR